MQAGLRRRRLTLPEVASVYTSTVPFGCGTNHTGVGTGSPPVRKVVSDR